MAQKLLRTVGGKRKVAAKGAVASKPSGIVVVGNYKTGQLDWIKKNGVYNWPVREEDGHAGRMTLPADAQGRGERPARPIQPDDLAKVNELWLYANAKSERHVFSAEFVGKMTAAEFRAAYPTYAKLGASKQKAYYVFKAKPVDYPPELGSQVVLARTADFGRRCAKVKKAVEQFKRDGEFAPLAAYLPKELGQVPRPQLRVCEAAVQLDFLRMVETKESMTFPFPAPTKGKFTFIDLFAGIGGIRLGFQLNGGRCVFSSEWDKDAAKTYYYNFGERPYGDIQKIDPKTIPDFDVLLAGFPCQPFAIRWRNAA